MKIIDLFEKRRNPEINKKEHVKDALNKYTGQNDE